MSDVLTNGKPDRKARGLRFEPQRDDPRGFSRSLLSDEEKLKIREKAQLMVQNELKDREEKALLAEYLKEERANIDPDEERIPIFLDLALHSPYIMLDGTQYLNNTLYHVPPRVFQVLTEQMSRGWAHEEETEVREEKSRRRARPPSYLGIGNYMDHRQPRDLKFSSGTLAGVTPSAIVPATA